MQDSHNLQMNNEPSLYVNISSSILRNKFEKNRISHLQNIAEKSNTSNLQKNEEIECLKRVILENDNKIKSILIESNNIENKMNLLTDSLNEKNDNITTSINDLRYRCLDYSENIGALSASMEDIKRQLQDFSVRLEDPTVNVLTASIQDIKRQLQDFSVRLDDTNNNNIERISALEKRVEEKIESLSISAHNEISETYTILKMIIDNILPKDFVWETYKALNDDLQEYNEFELKKHYLTYGTNENRIYRIEEKTLPEDFVWKEYLQMNIDIASLLTSKPQTENQYLNYGIKEKRMYKMSQLDDVNYFVYSGRKSGSSTLANTFSNLKNALSIQIHNNEDFLFKYGQCKYNSIFDLVDNNMKTQKKIFIFDSYRTPIEKKISSFFEDIDKYIPNYKECDVSYLISYFNKKYIYGKNCTSIYTEDYEPLDEIMEYYKLPHISKFDFEKKYTIIQHKNLIFVKIRFNEINQWDDILTKIIGQSVVIKDKNKSETKPYIEVYNNFKRLYRIPKEFLEKLKTDSRFITYNSKTERIKYIKDWSSKSE